VSGLLKKCVFFACTAAVVLPYTATSAAEPLQVFLLAGQSNMRGHGYNSDLPPELQLPQEDVLIYHNGAWGYLRPGLGKDMDRFGLEVTFGRETADAMPGDSIALIKHADGGTSLAVDWRPPSAGGQTGTAYSTFLQIVDDALASLDGQYQPHIAGMCWMQGEADSGALDMANDYEQNLVFFIQDMRSHFGLPQMPFVIGQISEAEVWTYGEIVRTAQLNVSETIAQTGLVVTSDLQLVDSWHYDSAGQIALGRRFAAQMQELLQPKGDLNRDGVVNFLDYAILTGL